MKTETNKEAARKDTTTGIAAPVIGSGKRKRPNPFLKVRTSLSSQVKKIRASRKRQYVALLVTVVATGVVVGLILYLLAWQRHEELARRPKLGQTAVINNATKSLVGGNYKAVQTTIAQSSNPKSKTNLLLSALAYEDQNNYKQALSQFKLSEKLYGLDSSLAINIGYADAQVGNKKEAVTYYQKAIALLQSSNDPNARQSIQALQQRINSL